MAATFAALALAAIIPLSACTSDPGITTTTSENVTGERPAINAEPTTTDPHAAIDAFDFVQPATLDALISGEQIVVTIGDLDYPVQLIGVDVPDIHAEEALDLVESTIAESGSQNLWLEFDDPLGRLDDTLAAPDAETEAMEIPEGQGPGLQAYVWTSHPETGELDQMLNLAQIEVGLATVAYTDTSDYRHLVQFRRAEGYARDRGFGLWADKSTVDSSATSSLSSTSGTNTLDV